MSGDAGEGGPPASELVLCPGCGLEMPADASAAYDGYYHCSPECWSVFTEVLGAEFGNAALFGRVHQLTVDAYAAQHAGGDHPDRSVGLHLAGLHLVLERGFPPTRVPPLHQALADSVDSWPRFQPPPSTGGLTVLEVALSDSAEEHAAHVEAWARQVWGAWSEHHDRVATLVARHLDVG